MPMKKFRLYQLNTLPGTHLRQKYHEVIFCTTITGCGLWVECTNDQYFELKGIDTPIGTTINEILSFVQTDLDVKRMQDKNTKYFINLKSLKYHLGE